MTEKLKIIILSTLLTLISASIGITSLVSNIFEGSTIYILLSSAVIIVIIISLIDLGSIKLKELINHPLIKTLSIIFLSFSLIYYLSIIGILINNLFYIITPITITLSIILILTIILSCNKRLINNNIFLLLGIISIIFIIFFTFLFPNSNLKLDVININKRSIYLYSYIILIVDLIFYKLHFSQKPDKTLSKTLIISSLTAIILLSFYTYLDLTITKVNYTNTPFRNILKYLLVLPNSNIYLDLLYLIIVFVVIVFKLIIYGDYLRILLLCKKNIKSYFFIYLIVFLVGNTLVNQVKNEMIYLNNLLAILTCVSILLIILIGGVRVVKRIYRFTKK
ncbi:MAG: hypothetical protein E7183_05310 [Erysipelotrichaceae bacterium]|nr:hypothetical protein [Erysipelotrichaceae bacterium]